MKHTNEMQKIIIGIIGIIIPIVFLPFFNSLEVWIILTIFTFFTACFYVFALEKTSAPLGETNKLFITIFLSIDAMFNFLILMSV